MSNDIKIYITVITTLLAMFATSLLLDLQIMQSQFIRKIIIYIAIFVQFYFGLMIYKSLTK